MFLNKILMTPIDIINEMEKTIMSDIQRRRAFGCVRLSSKKQGRGQQEFNWHKRQSAVIGKWAGTNGIEIDISGFKGGASKEWKNEND